ncbi:MAG: histone H1-like repetitive region-containing protein [Myxococcota bacterium]
MEAAQKEKLGQKWACVACGIKFYDLNSPEPSCPRCKADPRQAPAVAPKTKGRKSTAKKTTAKKTTAKKTTAKKTPAKKTTAKKTPAKKTTANKTPAKKTPAKKTTAKKTPAKKNTRAKKTNEEGSSEAGADPELELEPEIDDIDLEELDLAGSEDIADEEVTKD